ncbi:esterase/lipase family protein [Phycicoccus flavus]|uniref:esterase/lipase family protein n=1 Tax=Phycicoccus flavus TaxID=2502783 RepID=UPI000FEB7391|nr:alpha/beta fold hydrolase [Phycicoccus flavus]NHA68121.1 alpha/beta hydrolase [Phycicoccus flavus]
MTSTAQPADDAPGSAAALLAAPPLRDTGREWRTALDWAASAVRTRDLHDWPAGDGHPVLVIPGFLAGPESTAFLRQHLRRLGYRTYDWRHGRNLGVTPTLAAELEDLLLEIYDRYGRRVSIVGWSAGGIYARELARSLAHYTRAVVTLGSPFAGHPEATRAWAMYRLLNRGAHTADLFTAEAIAARAAPLEVPTTSIWSRTDGIVAWQCCVADEAPLTENVEVGATHLGYGHHLETLKVVCDRLAQPEGAWTPYVPPAGADPAAATEPPTAEAG